MFEPPVTNRRHGAATLRRALVLLKEAGWGGQDGVLRNAQANLCAGVRWTATRAGAHAVVVAAQPGEAGHNLAFRSVDFALYQQRLQKFDFDITTIAYQGTTTRARSLPTCSAARRPIRRTRATSRREEPPWTR